MFGQQHVGRRTKGGGVGEGGRAEGGPQPPQVGGAWGRGRVAGKVPLRGKPAGKAPCVAWWAS